MNLLFWEYHKYGKTRLVLLNKNFFFSMVVLFTGIMMIGLMPHSYAVDIVTNQHFAVVAEEPEKFQGIWLKVTGIIQNKQVFENGDGYIFKVGNTDGSRDQLWINDNSNSNFSIGDCLVVEGPTGEVNQLTNTFGKSWDVPAIFLDKFAEIECLEANYPTIAENKIPQTQTGGSGISVTVEKVELTKDHTRVLVTIENDSGLDEISFRSGSSILVQEKSQFKTDYLFGVDYDAPNYSIPNGLIEKGWIIFEPIDSKPFEIRLNFYETQSAGGVGDVDLVFPINSLTNLGTSVTPTPSSTSTPTSTPAPVDNTSDMEEIDSYIIWSDEEIKRLEKKVKELESMNTKLQNTIDELQNKLTQSGDSAPKIKKEVASFVDDSKDPQSYVDRYNNEASYKEWFDDNYPEYESIHEAVGKRSPVPDWIKNNAIWWSEGKLSEDEFVGGIEYLVKQRIIQID